MKMTNEELQITIDKAHEYVQNLHISVGVNTCSYIDALQELQELRAMKEEMRTTLEKIIPMERTVGGVLSKTGKLATAALKRLREGEFHEKGETEKGETNK